MIYEHIVKISDEVIEDVFDPDLPQRLIRCRDCRWYGADYECDNAHSPCFHNGSISDNWFCADGEPKAGEQE